MKAIEPAAVASSLEYSIELQYWRVTVSNLRRHLVKIPKYCQITTQLACAYLKGHLTGRALDWLEVLGYRVVEVKATDYAHLKQALTEQFLVVRNSDRCESGGDRSRSSETPPDTEHRTIRISSLQMTPVDLTYVFILLNETFITALWDKGAEKSFISEEVYLRYVSYPSSQKTKDRVVTAQRAPCCHLGLVELQILIREFQKTWEFHILNNMQYQFILDIDFMKEFKLTLYFDKKSFIIPDDQIKQLPKVEKPVEIDLSNTKLGEGQKQKLKDLFNSFKRLFSEQPGLTHVLYHEIDTKNQGPVVSRPYRYDRVKQGIIYHHIEKMLQEGTIRPIESPYASPVVLTRKNNGLPPDSPKAYRFAIDYRKLNAITKYPRYPLPMIDDLITTIPHTGIMSTLDLKLSYFQLAISPKDIEKTTFITRNGTFAFLRMSFGLSGAAPNFQKAIDMILKPVLGRFVMVYMDYVIITSPSFNEHIDHLNQVFTLLRDAGLTLNKVKCHFAREKLKYLGLIISKERIETDNNKVKAITEMKPPKNNKEVSKFLGMVGWYQKFIPHYADICELLYQLKKKGAKFNWSTEAQDAFRKVKRALTEAPVLQLPNFQEQFNLFTDATSVEIGAALNQSHRPIAFASRTLSKAERNYTVTERECLAVIWALDKFKTYFGSLPVKNIVTDVLSRNPIGNMDESQISCAALRALALNSREQLIREQREDPELGHIYRYLENPDDGSVNATVCEG
ncbi:retrovirus-related Pol polyprotein from transposon 297 [Trichonephila clavipes]|nr:retrovirus-related Pol polyprotein from transposon 297 [Trichonephila clavipes]